MPPDTIDISPPTPDGFIDNIARFSNLLRDNGVSVSLPAVIDTLKGLPLIDISRLQEFKTLLQANLIHHQQDIAIFNILFQAYWLSLNRRMPDISSGKSAIHAEEQTRLVSRRLTATSDTRSPGEPQPTSTQFWPLSYSPQSLLKHVPGEEFEMTDADFLYEAIRDLLKPLNNRSSRRFKYTVRGRDFSLRRVLRKNMQFGGELIFLDFKKRKVKKRRVLFFCDVSGSMDSYTRMILQFVHALNRIDRRTEIFFFSTELSRATDHFNVNGVNSAISRIPELTSNWGGGTRIGHCLRIFNQCYAGRMLSTRDIVIIFSDGWDRGEVDLLATQMARLKRKSYTIIWLNPLMGTSEYQPICQGMRTALPYVDSFLPMGNPRDLAVLGGMLVNMMT
jgi:uncharacterized protein with von Willebrand factor type A (vWA) domain